MVLNSVIDNEPDLHIPMMGNVALGETLEMLTNKLMLTEISRCDDKCEHLIGRMEISRI